MTSLELPLARLSIPTPRLVPAGASPKSLNWDSYSNCQIIMNVTSDPASLRLQIMHGSTTLIIRDLSASDLIDGSVTRRITHTGQQAAFRYDWPLNAGVVVKTQECFQVIFQDLTDLVSLLDHMKPFFTLQTSTIKPITVTASQQTQVQAKENSPTKKKTLSKPRQKKQLAKPTPITASPEGGLAGAAKVINNSSSASQPSSASNPRTLEANAFGSSSTAKSSGIDGTVPSILSPAGSRPVAKDIGRQSPLAHGTSTFSVNDPTITGLKRKLLAGFDPGAITPITMHPPSQTTKIMGSASHSELQTQQPASSHSVPYEGDPKSTTNVDAILSCHFPPTVPVQKPASNPQPSPVDLITFSSPIMSSTSHPPAPGPARMILGGSSDVEIGSECDWPVMLTEERRREETLKKLVEEDLDVEMNPEDGSAYTKVSYILSQASIAQYHNPYPTPSESHASLPPFTPRDESVYSQGYTDRSCYNHLWQDRSNYKRPASSLEYNADQAIWKRMRMGEEDMYLYDDLEEEDCMC
ncbi:hypothetical protein I307_03709 [Cryptococcus deuterogattii 99/473]|uniref:Uncharacterized protein n=1 Tax=Cryptococcus deuterogattii Ram5 TaxID=1296110 RepID=A0A0D0V759_9TREE|nr:hypothetical protein I313_00052 [Cryptococcus deuterogattii Ram5]KIY56971.1 hypothetical protein I307_03709 [Cryptococcus deuterogattii 99/473]